MKGGIAAMCVAAHQAIKHGLDGEVVIAAVIDEEYDSLGTQALLSNGIRTDAAIVTEATRLAICPAHRGFLWAEVDVHGQAAHGSRYDIGVDAITHAGLFLAELDRIQRELLPKRIHPLLGRASLHASTIQGGTGITTYPASCRVAIERRTIPGEGKETFQKELDSACDAVRVVYPSFQADVRIMGGQGPSDVPGNAPIVQTLSQAICAEQLPLAIEGMPAWTDAALLNAAGIPAVCFGPGDLTLAHAPEEYIPTREIELATQVLTRAILSWCNQP
jgi:acetylornithine deacetylase